MRDLLLIVAQIAGMIVACGILMPMWMKWREETFIERGRFSGPDVQQADEVQTRQMSAVERER